MSYRRSRSRSSSRNRNKPDYHHSKRDNHRMIGRDYNSSKDYHTNTNRDHDKNRQDDTKIYRESTKYQVKDNESNYRYKYRDDSRRDDSRDRYSRDESRDRHYRDRGKDDHKGRYKDDRNQDDHAHRSRDYSIKDKSKDEADFRVKDKVSDDHKYTKRDEIRDKLKDDQKDINQTDVKSRLRDYSKDRRKEDSKDRIKDDDSREPSHSDSGSRSSSGESRDYRSSRRRHHKYSRSRSYSRSPSRRDRSDKKYPQWRIYQTKTLCVQDVGQCSQLESSLTEVSISAGTSVPDDIEFKDNHAYARYPSIEVAAKVLEYLKESLVINDKQYSLNFFPFRRIEISTNLDWICYACGYKNFARRNRCYRCEAPKTESCKVCFDSEPMDGGVGREENCSIMLRGAIIMDIEEVSLLEAFEPGVKVKDIRMIRNKAINKNRDFAFVYFFTPEETAIAMKHALDPSFRVAGEKVIALYSRNRADHEPFQSRPFYRRSFDPKKVGQREVKGNYYNRQRYIYIERYKEKPLITMEQLKEKKEQELRKNAQPQKELTEYQNRRRKAEQLARQWGREAKMEYVMYICPICRRKFVNEAEMNNHYKLSDLHKYWMSYLKI